MTPMFALVVAFLSMMALVLFAFWVDHRRAEDIKRTIRQEVNRMSLMLTDKGIRLTRAIPEAIPYAFGKYWPDGAPERCEVAYQWPYWREDNKGTFIVAYTAEQIQEQLRQCKQFKPYIPPLADQKPVEMPRTQQSSDNPTPAFDNAIRSQGWE